MVLYILIKLIKICFLQLLINITKDNQKLKEYQQSLKETLFYGDIIVVFNEPFLEFMICGHL